MHWSQLPASSRPRVIVATFNIGTPMRHLLRERAEPSVDPEQMYYLFAADNVLYIELFFNDAPRLLFTSLAQFTEWFNNERVRSAEARVG